MGFLWLSPPSLLRVGANYSAKIVCSNVFLAGRDPEAVLRIDVQAPAPLAGITILGVLSILASVRALVAARSGTHVGRQGVLVGRFAMGGLIGALIVGEDGGGFTRELDLQLNRRGAAADLAQDDGLGGARGARRRRAQEPYPY